MLVISGALLVSYPAVGDVPLALVEWVTVRIVACEGGRRCRLSPSRRALIARECLCKRAFEVGRLPFTS